MKNDAKQPLSHIDLIKVYIGLILMAVFLWGNQIGFLFGIVFLAAGLSRIAERYCTTDTRILLDSILFALFLSASFSEGVFKGFSMGIEGATPQPIAFIVSALYFGKIGEQFWQYLKKRRNE